MNLMTGTIQNSSLFQHYFSDNSAYNELLGDDGNLRPHWQTFFQSFMQLGPEEIQNRTADIARLLKENGVTYNIYGDPAGFNRPWNLDIIPFMISKKEWDFIEAGLIQRAELLNLILADIYGDRRLIKKGIVPVELIYNHPGFIRQCAGINHKRKHSLIIYSADMARSPDGKIWILNDRTQAPSGSGYALENRVAMARVLPELFNGLKVRHIAAYFDTLRDSLNNIASEKKQNLRVVILTPGPGNETYFEHSYLSSYLGFTLVHGDDLMVKDNFVWLKTIGGLEKVDVILRRVDGLYCDPLELKEDSQLGVPGLVQAVRSGNVSIANPLGSSILENPGLLSFMHTISRFFLNEDLIMPTIASWWCGQPKELRYVLDNIHSLVIKRIHRDSKVSTSVDVASLATQQVSDLIQKIKAHPYLYVGQEKISFSSTPSLVHGKIEPRNALFRSFLVSNNDIYSVMPGGLSRTATQAGNFVISNQLGGIGKDTWIISPEQGSTYNVRKELIKLRTAYDNKGMLTSHIAENLFWVGRYAERILGNARFARTVIQFTGEGNRLMMDDDIETDKNLLQALTHYTNTYPGFVGKDAEKKMEDAWTELYDILFNIKRTDSISFNLSQFYRSVYAVRDHWSTDTWRVLRGLEEQWPMTVPQGILPFKTIGMLDALITSVVAFIGLNRESISREQGWSMLDMGRKIEQSMLLISMLRATLVTKHNEEIAYHLMESVLKSNESLVNYRYKYRVHIHFSLVLELMLTDPYNPRSLIYQLDRLKAYIADLPKKQNNYSLSEHERLILKAHTMLKLADKNELCVAETDAGMHVNLEIFLSKMYELLAGITGTVSKTFFKHAQKQKQLFSADTGDEA